ncbi:MAG: hypothetical protein U0350_11735 [Caldilineaceae bacterium]
MIAGKRWFWFSFVLLAGLWLAACGSAAQPTPDVVATRVAQDQAVAATLTAAAALIQAPPATPAPSIPAQVVASTATPTAPSATNTSTAQPPTAQPPTATPTPIVIEALPVDGENGNLTLRSSWEGNEGRNVFLPGFAHSEVTQLMVFHGRIALRIEVFDPQVGHHDGDGIQSVNFSVKNENGEEVYPRKETSAAYCLFGGDSPLCSTLVFAKVGNKWPNGKLITNGSYEADISIQPQHGENALWIFRFAIDGAAKPQTNKPDLFAQIVQTASNSTDTTLTHDLVFQVEAHDPSVGNHDGDGIDQLDLDIFGPNNKRVYHHTESTAHYCAFGGGEPNCNEFEFAQNNHHWPNNGAEIRNGQYRLVATVHAKDGRSKTIELKVQIQGMPH